MAYENCTSVSECSLGPSLLNLCTASAVFLFISSLEDSALKTDIISGINERIEPIKVPDDFYDFVVVGGGGAGSVVASRLSENPDWKVLVLEAGHDETVGLQIPAFMSLSFLKGEVNWDYKTIDETHACLSKNGSCDWQSAKMLGGSTAHNAMAYIRGNPTDFNKWSELGNEGWAWDDVLPYFKKAENNGEIERVGREYHSTGGPLSVERFPYTPPFSKVVLAAAAELGHNITEDLNGAQNNGWTEVQTTSKKGVRHSAAAAYLRPVRDRPNLHVSLNSLATKVVIENDIAVAVQYYKDGELKTVRANKEVILSAGAKRSPHLLLLSGVGPRQHLGSMRVEVVKDLSGVGENLHDHPGTYVEATINEAYTYDNDYNIAEEYIANQTGPLSCDGLFPVFALIPSSRTTAEYPDIQIGIRGYEDFGAPGEVGALVSTGKRILTIWTANLHPKSRGKVTLASNDPFDYPIIRGNYLSDPEDVEVLMEAAKIAMALINTETMKAHNLTFSDTPYEECSGYTMGSDEYWKCVIFQSDPTNYHDAGSCKMGPKSDAMAVVDPKLRVHGIKGLRVVDASIMPQVTSGNTAAPTIMIGERGADFIKSDHTECRVISGNTAAPVMMIGERGADFIKPDYSECRVCLPRQFLPSQICSPVEFREERTCNMEH